MYKLTFSIVLFLNLLVITSCEHNIVEPPEPTNEKGSLKVEMKHFFGDETLILNEGAYKTAFGEDVSVTTFMYYLSNFQLKRSDGTLYTYPQDSSYFLIRSHIPDTKDFNLKEIPAGDYTELSFIIGVDSARTCTDVSKHYGVLDPAKAEGMVWDWNTGYIFVKLEGNCQQVNNTSPVNYRYHIAGFGGCNPLSPTRNNIKKVTIPFNQTVKVQPSTTPEIHLKADVAKFFGGVTNWEIAKAPNIMNLAKESATLADNYATMFSLKEIH
ncbi:MAG: MbnP family protein [Bacteroidia bacterium]